MSASTTFVYKHCSGVTLPAHTVNVRNLASRRLCRRRNVASRVAQQVPSSWTAGMDVKELSVTADLIQSFQDELAGEEAGLSGETWVKQLIASAPESRVVFSAHGDGHSMPQHLSTGLSGDHLFLSLLQNDLIRDMLVIYTNKQIHSVLKFGLPVCGHPTIVHGGLISAIFDETFGVLLYTAGRWGHLDLEHGVFTARLEVDYKKPLPAESTIICTAEVESLEGRKIWVTAQLTDPLRETVYAASRALFVKPKAPPPTLTPVVPVAAAAAVDAPVNATAVVANGVRA